MVLMKEDIFYPTKAQSLSIQLETILPRQVVYGVPCLHIPACVEIIIGCTKSVTCKGNFWTKTNLCIFCGKNCFKLLPFRLAPTRLF